MWKNKMNTKLEIMDTVSQVGTFGTESAVRKRGGSRNLPYLNAKPRQIPLLVMQRMNSNAFFAAFARSDFAVKG